MELTLNDKGQLVDAEGNAVKINGEEITVTGAKRQDDVDRAFTAEKAKYKEKVDGLNARIKALEGQAEKSAEVARMLEDMRAEKQAVEAQLANAAREAEDKVASQLAAAKKEVEQHKQLLESERQARVREQVSTQILGAAKDQFNNPALDIVPHLLAAHQREPKKGPDGKDTGEYLDTFKMRFKNEKGEDVEEALPVDKALEVWGGQNPHHLRAGNRGGSGGGQYTHVGNMKRSDMSAAQKAEFVDKHGVEAFQGLPA